MVHAGRQRQAATGSADRGTRRWTEGIDPAKLEIELRSRFNPSEYAEVLLESNGDMLVRRNRGTMAG